MMTFHLLILMHKQNQRTEIEDDLEAVIFNNRIAENNNSINEVYCQQPPNQQQVFNYNHFSQQGYNSIPSANFDENILRRVRAQQELIQRLSNAKNVFWNLGTFSIKFDESEAEKQLIVSNSADLYIQKSLDFFCITGPESESK